MRRTTNGQVLVIFALILPGLLGALALGTDVAVLYFNSLQLQKAADAAVLAGANFLPDNPSQASTTAQQFAVSNGVKAGEIVFTTVASDDLSITMKVQRTVPWSFARALGLTSGIISAAATGAPQSPPSTVNATVPGSVPVGGDNNGNNGSTCANIGICGLLPIGLDTNTVYKDGQQITLQQGQLGPGNWDLVVLGTPGGSNLRTSVANGYNTMVSVGDWILSEPGQKVGPVDQGFQDRLNQAQSVDPSGTFSSYPVTDPRVLVLPVVDWEHPNGSSDVRVTAFATVWLNSYKNGQVNVNFISQVIANSFGSPGAPYFGARGTPILIQ